LSKLTRYAADHAADWLASWLRWFWRLPVLPKLGALALHVIGFYALASWLSVGALGSAAARAAALFLILVAVASLLFASAER
jgi:hypothetical protein